MADDHTDRADRTAEKRSKGTDPSEEEFGLDQPTDETEIDRGKGRSEPTPNPADIAP